MQKYTIGLAIPEDFRKLKEDCIRQFGEPLEFSYFSPKNLFDFNNISQLIPSEYPSVSVDQLSLFSKENLLPSIFNDNGEKLYPNYSSCRAAFIQDIIQKWKYDLSTLKQITDYEELIINVYTNGPFEYMEDGVYKSDDDTIETYFIKMIPDDNLISEIKLKDLQDSDKELIRDSMWYVEYVKELAAHPDYEKALAALKGLV